MTSRPSWIISAALATAIGAPALAQTPPPPPPKDFVNAVASSDQYEILAGETADAQSQDPRVKAFAEQMIRDHTQSTENLKRAVAQAGLPPPQPGLGDHAQMLAGIQGLTGPDFDRAYAKQQVIAHAEAVTVVGLYAQSGTAPALRQAAQGVLPMIRGHAAQAQQLKAALGGS